ncbi:hypothetical protein CSKR_106861 [Clonorchis sinensis]|uniref:Uncharacterized protein n=2 Tax=Clonorchis sinensis TaxID=79923 RepID=A0A8T1MCX5_CLOSI|nr:hypothetical protein CSKR_106861 [Clonorchis sinensis]GAA54166.1 zinc finger and BTB domain-containing protein 41 [Clonorchis sinensis]
MPGLSNPRFGFQISGPISDEIKDQHIVVAMSQWCNVYHLINEVYLHKCTGLYWNLSLKANRCALMFRSIYMYSVASLTCYQAAYAWSAELIWKLLENRFDDDSPRPLGRKNFPRRCICLRNCAIMSIFNSVDKKCGRAILNVGGRQMFAAEKHLVVIIQNLSSTREYHHVTQLNYLHEAYAPVSPATPTHLPDSSVQQQANSTHTEGEFDHYIMRCPQGSIRSEPVGSINLDKRRKEYQCPDCNRPFRFFSQMQEHLRVHVNSRGFRCHICEKSYKFLRGLREHLRVDHEDVPDVHTRQSTGEFGEPDKKGHLCPECGKLFTRGDHLDVHRKTQHANAFLHTCEFCSRSFNRKTNFMRHLKTQHGQADHHKCDQCEQSFANSIQLQAHVLTEHKVGHA